METVARDFPKPNACPGLVVCDDPFRALQIDSEYNGIGWHCELFLMGAVLWNAIKDMDLTQTLNPSFLFVAEDSGKRINQLSAPLARAGISIFYLSTYQTDFVFVGD